MVLKMRFRQIFVQRLLVNCENECPSPDCRGNPFWAFSAQKDWNGKREKAPKKNLDQ